MDVNRECLEMVSVIWDSWSLSLLDFNLISIVQIRRQDEKDTYKNWVVRVVTYCYYHI